MDASQGIRPPLRVLQGLQAATTFVQVDFPPRDFGVTWSSDRLRPWAAASPQYWQLVLVARKDVAPAELHLRRGTLS